MTDWTDRRAALDADLEAAVAADPLAALVVTTALVKDVTEHQRGAVRLAAQQYSWAEIGAALGISRQAAHQKFAKLWAEELKGELRAENRALKTAVRSAAQERAAEAGIRRQALIDEFKGVRRANKKPGRPPG